MDRALRFGFGKAMVSINASLVCLDLVPNFHEKKSGRISPYFHGGNPAVLLLRCVIVHKTLFSPSFCCENAATEVPYFQGRNPIEFHVWCTMAHRQGFIPMYTACANMLMLGRAEAPQSIKHIDACRIQGETNVTWWHGSRQSHHNNYAHNIAWICSYSNFLGHIPTLQGQEGLWLD